MNENCVSFSVASYNILADAYINPEWYPGVPSHLLAPTWRRPALLRYIQKLEADVLCLQEVESSMFRALQTHLQPLGYAAYYARKQSGKPDGCASFVKRGVFEVSTERILHFSDGQAAGPNSGHVALMLTLEGQNQLVGIANTHLKWDPPGTPAEEQWGYRQVTQLLQVLEEEDPAFRTWIICGDLNVTSDSDVIRKLKGAGFEDAYAHRAHMNTCIANRKAKRIDYLLHTAPVAARPADLPAIMSDMRLPSEREPSDHLAIMARFDGVG